MTDTELLNRFAKEGAQDAFAELVRRHMDVVYTAARRQAAGDAHLAEDITQRVFILLSQKAAKLQGDGLLGGWLINAVRFVARNELRANRRRSNHETRAATMANQTQEAAARGESSSWRDVENVLDDAMAKLDRESRGVLVLRYLEGRTTREVGDRLGISEVAARKRVSRAIEQLRGLFARAGLVLSSSQIAEGLAIPALHAPAHLLTSTISAASSAGAAKAGSVLIGGKTLLVTSISGVIILTALVVLAVTSKSDHPATATTVSPKASATTAPTKPPGVVYEADFAKGAGPEWSMRSTTLTKDKTRAFLGPLLEPELRFNLDGLPPHQFIRLTFDLLTYDRWNGDGQLGRDLWDMRVVGGQPLIHTTFSNCGMFGNNNEQSFPDQYPWYPGSYAWTGAATRQSLGYLTPSADFVPLSKVKMVGCDSTYVFDITFPHSDGKLELAFKSQLKQHSKKPYGFLSFKVTTIDRPASADEKTLAGWWDDLSGQDAIKAYKAAWSLIATGDTATEYIRSHPIEPSEAGNAPPINIDQNALWHYRSFKYMWPWDRQQARAIHVLEVIKSPASLAILKSMGFNGTPQGGPPDRFSTPPRATTAPTQPTPQNEPAI